MSHLIQITTTGEIATLDYDETAPSHPQLLRVLSTEGLAVDRLGAPGNTRREHITVWADSEANTNDGRLNFIASAYAGTPIIGTAAISGFNTEAGAVGLTADQAAEVRDQTLKASDRASGRFGVLARLAQF